MEKGLGKDVDNKCPKLDPRLKDPVTGGGELQCFANKINATSTITAPVPYAGPTATIRNTAYQAHLREIWDKWKELNDRKYKAVVACQTLFTKLDAEKKAHKIKYQPGGAKGNHPKGTAFDVPEGTAYKLIQNLTGAAPDPKTDSLATLQKQRSAIAAWLAKPPSCGLVWGGTFDTPKPDFVHFQLP